MEINDSRIHILDTQVIDQIAAGEVLERPSHMVKELIENSVDAGSTTIEIEFNEGGKEVLITDNGKGIHPDDLPLALNRHATSKILKANDIWKLKTFGFRGEALASIAAVSNFTLSSRQSNFELGTRIHCEFGNMNETENKIGHQIGTQVFVRNLFENVPARLKFLRSQAAESTQIKNVIKAMALANPLVEFKVMQDHQLLYYWPKSPNRLERAKTVLELDSLFEGTANRDYVKSYSVFTDPQNPSRTSKNIWIFAQNRWVHDKSIQAAVTEAYRHLLMHGEYPQAVVWLETDPEHIDVNIHPTKSQVKFSDPSLVFRAVQASIRDTLEKAPWLPTKSEIQKSSNIIQQNSSLQNLYLNQFDQERTQFNKKEFISYSQKNSDSQSTYEKSKSNLFAIEHLELLNPVEIKKVDNDILNYWSRLEVLTQAGVTYIICQDQGGLVIVDQHAAHERVLFEKFMTYWKQGGFEIQEFLFPIAIDLKQEEVEVLLKSKESFAKLGIEIEQLGPETLGVKSAPLLIKDSGLGAIFEKTATEMIQNGDSFIFESWIGDICATLACHSAIRAGQTISLDEAKSLLRSMDEFPLSSFCPHGRPVSVSYPFTKLEKDFGRIV